jgi:hypothetical protein
MIRGELFSQDMVKAFLENRKCRTSRPIKCKYDNTHIKWFTNKYGTRLVEMQNDVEGETFGKNLDGSTWHHLLACRELKPKHSAGDIVYARETFRIVGFTDGKDVYDYKADGYDPKIDKGWLSWHPSLHMPREAARFWFRATDVKVQRLDDVTEQDAVEDGFKSYGAGDEYLSALDQFKDFWWSTYPNDQWMFVYYQQLITKEEALKDER